ncbi:MAG: SDR family oxidoreductase [Verrucomicrobiota bacterium]
MKHSLITGAGSGIGRATALNLAKRGDHVWVLDHNSQAADQTTEMITQINGSAEPITCDVSDPDSIEQAFSKIDRLDNLVNNAGIAHVGDIGHTSLEDFEHVYQVNVKGAFLCLRKAIPKMLPNGGSIVNLASIASKVGIEDRFAYSMSKGAIFTMSLSIARDYVKKGIRCNCVCPGRVHTPFIDGYLKDNYPEDQRAEVFEKLSSYQPIGRMGRPEEIASLIGFLTSDDATFITASAYDIDGGVSNLQ